MDAKEDNAMMAGLEEKVMDMYGEQRSISEKLKATDRRLKALDEHLRHSGNYKAYAYIVFFNEERPAYSLGYLTPKQYKDRYGACV